MRRFLPILLAAAAIPAALPAQRAQLQAGQARPITAAERAEGQRLNGSITAEYGGAFTGRQAAYVEQVGRRIATRSGLGANPGAFDVILLNSPVDNAFAIPGGYVYVTRNLVALMNDEAELAAVMGHEVAHVAARHGQKRQSAARRNTIFGALGQAVLGAVVGDSGLGGLLQRGAGSLPQLLTLGYSRSQETESDDLAVRYLSSAGYDPAALSTMLESLADQSALTAAIAGEGSGGARSTPRWASTHPDPASRVRRAQQQAAAVRAPTGTAPAQRNRDAFLAAIDGMPYGEDPQQGVIEGRRFLHPALGVGFEAPAGFTLRNTARAVSIAGQGAQGEFSTAPYSGDLNAYVGNVLRQLGGGSGAVPTVRTERTTVNGLPAAYASVRANSGNTPVDVTVFAYQLSPTRAVHFTALSAAGQGPGALEPVFGSLRRLTPADTAAIKPRFVRVVTVRPGDTPASLSARMAYPDGKLDRFLVLNRLEENAQLRPGDKVKVVTY